jgi:hypothetical protein
MSRHLNDEPIEEEWEKEFDKLNLPMHMYASIFTEEMKERDNQVRAFIHEQIELARQQGIREGTLSTQNSA